MWKTRNMIASRLLHIFPQRTRFWCWLQMRNCTKLGNSLGHNIKCNQVLELVVSAANCPKEMATRTTRYLHHCNNQSDFAMLQVILKMDKEGNGLEIDQSNLGRCRSLGNVFTEEKFRYMCILSGCDYLPSLHGIGLGKACKLLRLAKDPDILKVRLLKHSWVLQPMQAITTNINIFSFLVLTNNFKWDIYRFRNQNILLGKKNVIYN